ncbi:hypothetical protein BJN34_09640 [Cupriavidus necator]|uniref:Uncharacterized protein n=1 Tax=Cupriavidus necator TaxID=106590 RepID=A0A1U9UNH4_CUPNE|nr:hypothetical protein BJN34_09640 [Cupriavidus necator]
MLRAPSARRSEPSQLLVISLLESGAGYEAQAEVLHRNAEGLTAFQWKVAQCLAQMDTGRGSERT